MASISALTVSAAPGNTTTVASTGLASGPATVVVAGQLAAAVNGVSATASVAIPATISATGVVTFVAPDGIQSGAAIITDGGSATAAFALAAVSQYAFAADFVGVGSERDPLGFQPGEVDLILQRSSAIIDAFVGATLRQQRYFERHRFRKSRRFYPYHRPVRSVDSLAFVTSNTVRTTFNAADLYVDPDLDYVEMLAYGFGNYALLGAFETVGYSANVLEVTLTAGYAVRDLPNQLRQATVLIAASLADARPKRILGLAGLTQLEKDSLTNDGSGFTIPGDVKAMLRRFTAVTIR